MLKDLSSKSLVNKSCKYNYCVAVDWLEVCCYGSGLREGFCVIDGRRFEVYRTDKETALFRNLFEIKSHNLVIAEVKQNPRTTAIRKGLTLVKLSNRVLYSEQWAPLLIQLLKMLNLRYHGITRIDIAYDCNYYSDGRNPRKFLRDYVMKPLDEVGGIYLAGCKSFNAYGRKSISSNGTFNYLSFHSNNSKRRGYIYDKSLELQEKKDKPWIRKMWEDNGLVNDDKHHVWRSEISLRGDGSQLLNLDTGELFKLHIKYLDAYTQIVKLFHFYAGKVFDFRINSGQKNRRNFTRLNLFDTNIIQTCLPKRVSVMADTGRAEKICYNKLDRLSKTYTDISGDVRRSIYSAMQFLTCLSGIKADRYKAEQYGHYLDMFAGTRFIAEEEFAYMQACEDMFEKKLQDREAEDLYQKYVEYRTALAMAEVYP